MDSAGCCRSSGGGAGRRRGLVRRRRGHAAEELRVDAAPVDSGSCREGKEGESRQCDAVVLDRGLEDAGAACIEQATVSRRGGARARSRARAGLESGEWL